MEGKPDSALTREIIAGAIEVHRALGPGLLESSYEECLTFELTQRALSVERQKSLPIVYKGVQIDCGYRLDLVVERRVILELKSVRTLIDLHDAQLLSYLRLSGCRLGLLINFNVRWLRQGIRRLAI